MIDLTRWKLTTPHPGTDGLAVEVLNLVGYNLSPYFVQRPGGTLQFDAPVDGAKTKGTKYARSELREMNGGKPAAWTLKQGGTLKATCRVLSAPRCKDGSAGKMVTGQIHGKTDELCRLYWDNGTMYFVSDISGTDHREHTWHLYDAFGNVPKVAIGEEFSYKIFAHGKHMVVQVYADGTWYRCDLATDPLWQKDTLYFKAGVYLGVNSDVDANGKPTHGGATGSGSVEFSALEYSHP